MSAERHPVRNARILALWAAGFSNGDVAAKLGCSPEAVTNVVFRARRGGVVFPDPRPACPREPGATPCGP